MAPAAPVLHNHTSVRTLPAKCARISVFSYLVWAINQLSQNQCHRAPSWTQMLSPPAPLTLPSPTGIVSRLCNLVMLMSLPRAVEWGGALWCLGLRLLFKSLMASRLLNTWWTAQCLYYQIFQDYLTLEFSSSRFWRSTSLLSFWRSKGLNILRIRRWFTPHHDSRWTCLSVWSLLFSYWL